MSSKEVSRCQVKWYRGVKRGGTKVSSEDVSRCQEGCQTKEGVTLVGVK